jgi:AcrR family transcriptional regulator
LRRPTDTNTVLRAARHQEPGGAGAPSARRGPSGGAKKPITVEAIIAAALGIVEREGYQALTMRRVASALETGPSSLYAHVVNKEDLDELLIGRLCAKIDLPEPDAASWRHQVAGVCAQLRDQYLRYPGISRAAFAVAPSNLDTLRVSEGMLAILLAGGIDPQVAAWAMDSLLLYVSAYSLEISLADQQRSRGDGGWGQPGRAAAPVRRAARHLPLLQALRHRAHRRNRPRPLRLHHWPDDRRPRTPLGSEPRPLAGEHHRSRMR